MPQQVLYTARFFGIEAIQRATTQTIECAVYRDGASVAVTSGTVTIKDSGGVDVVAAGVVTVVGGVATYEITAATVPATMALSDRWTVRWDLVMPDRTQVYPFRREAALALTGEIYPVITDLDMTTAHTELAQWASKYNANLQNYQDSAWKQVIMRLAENGKRQYLILNSTALYTVHLSLSLTHAFRDMATQTGTDGKYWKMAELYQADYEKAWDRLQLEYDTSEDDIIDDGEQVAAEQSVWLGTVLPKW